MFPWYWIWSPRFDYPLSGNVSQDIATDWFFSGIKPESGDARLEQAIFEHASYGKQIGVLTEVVSGLIEGMDLPQGQGSGAQQQLLALRDQIGTIKQQHRQADQRQQVDQAVNILLKLKQLNPQEFKRAIHELDLKGSINE